MSTSMGSGCTYDAGCAMTEKLSQKAYTCWVNDGSGGVGQEGGQGHWFSSQLGARGQESGPRLEGEGGGG